MEPVIVIEENVEKEVNVDVEYAGKDKISEIATSIVNLIFEKEENTKEISMISDDNVKRLVNIIQTKMEVLENELS